MWDTRKNFTLEIGIKKMMNYQLSEKKNSFNILIILPNLILPFSESQTQDRFCGGSISSMIFLSLNSQINPRQKLKVRVL